VNVRLPIQENAENVRMAAGNSKRPHSHSFRELGSIPELKKVPGRNSRRKRFVTFFIGGDETKNVEAE
jgi:hypothetical protein